MGHVTGVCCRCVACSKSPAGEGCQDSLVPLQSLQYLQLSIIRQLRWHPTGTSSDFSSENDWNLPHLPAVPELVQGAAPSTVQVTSKRRRSTGQISSCVGMSAPSWTVMQTLFPVASVFSAALLSNGTP